MHHSLAGSTSYAGPTLGQHEIATLQTTAIDATAGMVNLTTTLARMPPANGSHRIDGIGAASGSPIFVDLAGAQPALSRMLRGGSNKDAMRVAGDDIH